MVKKRQFTYLRIKMSQEVEHECNKLLLTLTKLTENFREIKISKLDANHLDVVLDCFGVYILTFQKFPTWKQKN